MDTHPDNLPPAAVTATASPVLELVYAHYLIRREPEASAEDPGWLQQLRDSDPQLVAELTALAADDGRYDLFIITTELDLWTDDSPDRFLGEARDLPRLALGKLRAREDGDEHRAALMERLEAGASDAGYMRPDLLSRLWDHLKEEWRESGLEVVSDQAAAFMDAYRETGDVVRALPPFHFTRLEKPASLIRGAGRDETVIVPLYFANAGGFSFQAGGRRFIGYGLQSDAFFHSASRRVDAEARKLKALADPTRLLLLTLITRYAAFSLTVGDLARHLDVSQPTVSGHLKVLREAGLVTVDREANRSYYRPQPEAVSNLLDELGSVLLPRRT